MTNSITIDKPLVQTDFPTILDIPDYLEENVFGLSEFPEELFCIVYPGKKYAIYKWQGIHGLACFAVKEKAEQFANLVPDSKAVILAIEFDEARDIAKIKSQTTQCCCVMLLDDINNPEIHYVV